MMSFNEEGKIQLQLSNNYGVERETDSQRSATPPVRLTLDGKARDRDPKSNRLTQK